MVKISTVSSCFVNTYIFLSHLDFKTFTSPYFLALVYSFFVHFWESDNLKHVLGTFHWYQSTRLHRSILDPSVSASFYCVRGQSCIYLYCCLETNHPPSILFFPHHSSLGCSRDHVFWRTIWIVEAVLTIRPMKCWRENNVLCFGLMVVVVVVVEEEVGRLEKVRCALEPRLEMLGSETAITRYCAWVITFFYLLSYNKLYRKQ